MMGSSRQLLVTHHQSVAPRKRNVNWWCGFSRNSAQQQIQFATMAFLGAFNHVETSC